MIPLKQLVSGVRPETATLDRPLDHLTACHRRIEERLDVLERVAACGDSERAAAGDAISACLKFFDTSGVLHTQDEEESIFPRMRAALRRDEQQLLESLEREHEEADRIYLELKAAFRAGALDRCREHGARLAGIYRSHIATEDSRLMEIARRVLAPSDLAEISSEMKRRRGLG